MSAVRNVKKFGRVFLSCRGDPYKQLENVCCSNFDLKLYSFNGDIHSQFERYQGKSFSLGFQLENVNRYGTCENFHGKFLLPFKLGEMESPDFEYLEQAHQRERKIAQELNLIGGDDDPRFDILRNSQITALFLFMSPGKKLLRSSTLLAQIAVYIMLDDLMDSNCFSMAGLKEHVSYKHFAEIGQGLKSIISGKLISTSTNGRVDSKELTYSQINGSIKKGLAELQQTYGSLIQLTRNIRRDVRHLTQNEQDSQPFFLKLEEVFDAFTLEYSREWNRKNHSLLRPAQVALGQVTVSILLVAEGMALQLGIRLREEIRCNFLFKWYLQEVANHSSKVNDLVSYNKEFTKENNGTQNEVYILHVENRLELEMALRKVLDDANESLVRIVETTKLLLEMFNGDDCLAKYIKVINGIIMGHIIWLSWTDRYHSNMIYDCYVNNE